MTARRNKRMGYNYYAKGETYTEEEEKLRWENVHLAGHKRYNFGYSGSYDSFYKYNFRGKSFTKEYLDEIFKFETDDMEECYSKINDFISAIDRNFPQVFSDSTESNLFFGVTKFRGNRGCIEICDNVGTNSVNISWDDVVRAYHMLKVFGLWGNDNVEDTE